jgi:hypothetical protein
MKANPTTPEAGELSELARSTTRVAVYHAIDSEREYQDRLWGGTLEGGRPGNGFRTVDAYAAYLQRYQNVLIECVGTSDDDSKKLEIIRKIAGLCVVCMEQHGAPLRDSGSRS